MASRMTDSLFVRGVNAAAVALLNAPVLGRIVGRGLVRIRYVGRRSGKIVELPVGYRRSGDDIIIGVAAPGAKTWWRNFLGDGGPITLLGLDGRDRIAHAVANRDAQAASHSPSTSASATAPPRHHHDALA